MGRDPVLDAERREAMRSEALTRPAARRHTHSEFAIRDSWPRRAYKAREGHQVYPRPNQLHWGSAPSPLPPGLAGRLLPIGALVTNPPRVVASSAGARDTSTCPPPPDLPHTPSRLLSAPPVPWVAQSTLVMGPLPVPWVSPPPRATARAAAALIPAALTPAALTLPL